MGRPDKPADLRAPMDITKLPVRAMALGGLLTPTARPTADLVLPGEAAWMQRPQRLQLAFEGFNFPLNGLNTWRVIHVGYHIYDEAECKTLAGGFLQSAAQAVAAAQTLVCPRCHKPLHVEAQHRDRMVQSLFGPVRLVRGYGLCPRCQERFFPADAVLGLLERAPHSPRVQEICAILALGSPFARAQKSIGRVTGLDLSLATVHREALRQGQRALQLRDADVALSKLPGGGSLQGRRSIC